MAKALDLFCGAGGASMGLHRAVRVDDTDQYGVGPCWHFNGADLSKTTWTWVCSGEPPRVCPEGFCVAITGNNGDLLDSGCACMAVPRAQHEALMAAQTDLCRIANFIEPLPGGGKPWALTGCAATNSRKPYRQPILSSSANALWRLNGE